MIHIIALVQQHLLLSECDSGNSEAMKKKDDLRRKEAAGVLAEWIEIKNGVEWRNQEQQLALTMGSPTTSTWTEAARFRDEDLTPKGFEGLNVPGQPPFPVPGPPPASKQLGGLL